MKLLLGLAVVLLYGCSASNPSSRYLDHSGLQKRVIKDEVVAPELFIMPESDTSVVLSMNVGAGGTADSPEVAALNAISEVHFVVVDAEGAVIDSLYTDLITRSGIQSADGTASISASATVRYSPEDMARANSYHVVMLVRSADRFYTRHSAFDSTDER